MYAHKRLASIIWNFPDVTKFYSSQIIGLIDSGTWKPQTLCVSHLTSLCSAVLNGKIMVKIYTQENQVDHWTTDLNPSPYKKDWRNQIYPSSAISGNSTEYNVKVALMAVSRLFPSSNSLFSTYLRLDHSCMKNWVLSFSVINLKKNHVNDFYQKQALRFNLYKI